MKHLGHFLEQPEGDSRNDRREQSFEIWLQLTNGLARERDRIGDLERARIVRQMPPAFDLLHGASGW